MYSYQYQHPWEPRIEDTGATSGEEGSCPSGCMERGEDRFHKKFTPHTYRTVFTTLMRNQGMKQYIRRYIRGDAASETMDIYIRVDREDGCEEYLKCIKILGL